METQTQNNMEDPKNRLFQFIGNYDNQKADENFDDILKSMQNEQVTSLNNSINDIRLLISERETLNYSLFKDIEKIKMDINNFILEAGPDVQPKDKLEMRKKLIEIEELKLQEKLNTWRDVAMLKKELREKMKEQEEKVNRLSVLDQILEE
jgi:hypothetical protein